jgi:hypothetical protein
MEISTFQMILLPPAMEEKIFYLKHLNTNILKKISPSIFMVKEVFS